MNKKMSIGDTLDLFAMVDKSNGNRHKTHPEPKAPPVAERMVRRRYQPGEIYAALDIGTNKIAMLITEIDDEQAFKIIGVGVAPSEGLRRGVVVNLEKTVQSIEKAVREAEMMAGVQVHSVYVGIAGDHIRSINSRGVVAVSGANHEIKEEDVRRVIEAAKAISLPPDREILHVLQQEYIVDNQAGIKNPIGFSGVRLETEVHIVTGAVTSKQNIDRCVQRAGLRVKGVVLEPLASSMAVLGDDEKEIGVGLIDLGGGTTDIALFFEGSIRHTAVIALGGQNVTNDIAQGLRTRAEEAEKLKLKYGCALASTQDNNDIIEVTIVGGRSTSLVPRSVLTAIIQPRVEEILTLAKREIQRSDYADFLNAGIVLTGGGALLEGIIELAEQIFDMPVKLGIPRGFGGLVGLARSPIHSTGIGLIHHALNQRKETDRPSRAEPIKKFHWGDFVRWLKRLLTDFF